LTITIPANNLVGVLVFLKQLPGNGFAITSNLNTNSTASSRRIGATGASAYTSGAYSVKVVPVNATGTSNVDFYISYSAVKPTEKIYDATFNYPNNVTYFMNLFPNGQWYFYMLAANRKGVPITVSLTMGTPTFDPASIPSGGDPSTLPFQWTVEIIVVVACAGGFAALTLLIIFFGSLCMCLTICDKNPEKQEREMAKKLQQKQRKMQQQSESELTEQRRNEFARKQKEIKKKGGKGGKGNGRNSTAPLAHTDIEMALVPSERNPFPPQQQHLQAPPSPSNKNAKRPARGSPNTLVQPFTQIYTGEMIGSGSTQYASTNTPTGTVFKVGRNK
jgi:hypothetical protein